MRWSLMLGLLATLAACPSKEEDTGEGGDETGGGGDTADTVDASVAPFIVSVDTLECTTQQSAGEVWLVQITADDPQGAETVEGGTILILNSAGGELADYALTCNNGMCLGNFRADYDSITCSLEGEITFRFTVVDEDGNVSEAWDEAT